jgi:hypothetical protein
MGYLPEQSFFVREPAWHGLGVVLADYPGREEAMKLAGLEKTLSDGSHAYCSIGSIEAKSEGTTRILTLWLLESVCGGNIASFNDHPSTTWEDVQAVFAVAIKHAQRFAL